MKSVIFIFIAVSITFSSCKKCECNTTKETITLNIQPDGDEGQDALVAVRVGDGGANANGNHSYVAELNMLQWTYNANGWSEGTNRSYIKFNALSQIPASSEILSAKLSLYGLSQSETAKSPAAPEGNSTYSGSPYNGSNSSWIKRVIGGSWSESTITWNNKPATTDNNQVAIPASTTRYDNNVLDLDVTALVKDIVSSQQNYGFCLQLQTEQIYRSLLFAASEFPVASKRPKLVVQYR